MYKRYETRTISRHHYASSPSLFDLTLLVLLNTMLQSLLILAFLLSYTLAASFINTFNFKSHKFLSLSGTLITPPRIPQQGTPYIWVGLQPPGDRDVLQCVLDGRSKHWFFGNAFVGRNGGSKPFGGSIPSTVNQRLGFTITNKGG
jgi:hypothetical protein